MQRIPLDSFTNWESFEQDVSQIVDGAKDLVEAQETLENRYDPPLTYLTIEEVEDDPSQFRVLIQLPFHSGAYLFTIFRRSSDTEIATLDLSHLSLEGKEGESRT